MRGALLLLLQQHLVDVHVEHFKLKLVVTNRILELLLLSLRGSVCRVSCTGLLLLRLQLMLLVRLGEYGICHLGQALLGIIFSQADRVLVIAAPGLAQRLSLVVSQHRRLLLLL